MDEQDELVRLLIRERSSIVAYARSIVFNRELAEDVYQNVAVVVLRKRDQVENTGDMLRWILGVARLESLTVLKKLKKTPKPFDEGLLDLLDQSWSEHLKERAADDSVREEALQHCVNKLTDRSRRMLSLRYAEGLSGEALAEKLGMQLNTAYVGLSRIHRQLRGCVESYQARSNNS